MATHQKAVIGALANRFHNVAKPRKASRSGARRHVVIPR
jgi:hypothetical protein